MLLGRKYPFESTNITVESFPLNLTFSRGEKELTTPICTFETASSGREIGGPGPLLSGPSTARLSQNMSAGAVSSISMGKDCFETASRGRDACGGATRLEWPG